MKNKLLWLLCPLVLLLTGCNTATTSTVGGIAGKVTNIGGTHLAGALIWISPTTVSTSTDASGDYSLPSLTAGTYTIHASKEGYNASAGVLVPAGTTASGDLVLGTAITSETFAEYSLGTLPGASIWKIEVMGGATLEVTSEAITGGKALRIRCSDTAESAAISLTFPTTEVFSYSFYVKPSNSNSIPQFLASEGTSGLLGMYYYEGHFWNIIGGSADPDMGAYAAGQWYKMKYRVDRRADTYSVWIDDEIKIDNDNFSGTDIPNGIMLSANLATTEADPNYTYFDDIYIYTGPE